MSAVAPRRWLIAIMLPLAPILAGGSPGAQDSDTTTAVISTTVVPMTT